MPQVAFRKVSKTYLDGTLAVSDLNLSLEHGEFLCVLGPSGCGKSSTLRMLAGLEEITAGDLVVDGQRMNDVPPQDRDMAMVFENYALYPHLRVFDNIAMPLVARGVKSQEIKARVAQVAETLQLTEHLRKRPQQLSGGQRQRVALGRAIVRTPKLFLMDEPLGHLEAYLRVQLRVEIRRLHERLNATTFYITHDQEEAAAVSDRIVVMNKGRVQQSGTLVDLLDRPANRFVAEFIGNPPINLIPAAIRPEAGAIEIGAALLSLSPGQAGPLREQGAARGVVFGIRPGDISVGDASPLSTLAGTVAVLEPQGETTVLVVDTPVGRVSAVVPSHGLPNSGATVHLRFAPERGHLFAEDGSALLNGIG
jgi:multiple sugar transport system ATP-binding protein